MTATTPEQDVPDLSDRAGRLWDILCGLADETDRVLTTNRQLGHLMGSSAAGIPRVVPLALAELKEKGFVVRFYEPDGTPYLQLLE